MGSSKLIFWFDEIEQDYNNVVGKKSAKLGAMKQTGMPIPLGFAICIDAISALLKRQEFRRCRQRWGDSRQVCCQQKDLLEVNYTDTADSFGCQ